MLLQNLVEVRIDVQKTTKEPYAAVHKVANLTLLEICSHFPAILSTGISDTFEP